MMRFESDGDTVSLFIMSLEIVPLCDDFHKSSEGGAVFAVM